mmetsp:Transcript_15295/g.25829  ORF Transcript_15295/g.25829 Transcript_15295/m.25829 type:complete len:85 (-) Transcript_15295:440-694(-)
MFRTGPLSLLASNSGLHQNLLQFPSSSEPVIALCDSNMYSFFVDSPIFSVVLYYGGGEHTLKLPQASRFIDFPNRPYNNFFKVS